MACQILSRGTISLITTFLLIWLNQRSSLFFLCFHGIEISLRQLKRVLRRQGLRRRKDHSDISEILNAIETELEGSGNNIGYRQMHQRLRIVYGHVVQKETVQVIIKELDPAGVQSLSSKPLRRREYRSKGPNYSWHTGG